MTDRTWLNTKGKPTWCPGCGNFGIQASLKKAILDQGIEAHRVALVSGIGCSGKMPHWINVNGYHGLHGRVLPAAAGVKFANHALTVIAEGGDGDGYSEGLGHFLHACRRNMDLTYVVHNNGVFGLTTGQTSPTGDKGFVSSTTPMGTLEDPFHPLALAVTGGATFVARGFSGDIPHLAGLIGRAINHPGFAFVDVLQVCVSFNPSKSYAWYRDRIEKLEDLGHDPTDREAALTAAFGSGDRIPLGVFYEVPSVSHEAGLGLSTTQPLAERDVSNVDVSNLMKNFV